MKFSSFLTLCAMGLALAACAGDFDYLDDGSESDEFKACQFYGNCEKPKTAECAFWGRCDDKKDDKKGGRTNDSHSSSVGGDMGSSVEHKQ